MNSLNDVFEEMKICRDEIEGFPFNLGKAINSIGRIEYIAPGKPTDIIVFMDKIYILYEESNSLIIQSNTDLDELVILPLDNYPCSMCLDEERGIIYIASFLGGSLNIVDCKSNTILNKINNFSYPTKVLLSRNKNYLYICEGVFDGDNKGYLSIFDVNKKKVNKNIRVGEFPIDIFEDEGYIYICNLGEGSISVISLLEEREIYKFFIGGSPKIIEKDGNYLFVQNTTNNKIYKLDLEKYL